MKTLTRQDVRRRLGPQGNLLQAALGVHMMATGAMEIALEDQLEMVGILEDALGAWEPSAWCFCERFDDAVKAVIEAALAEHAQAWYQPCGDAGGGEDAGLARDRDGE